ncbi:MAG: T9SS type A sorting domain-containing protein [Bacteroidia bacterium]
MMKYSLLTLLIAASFAQVSAQFVHEPKDGNPNAAQPAFQIDFQWDDSLQMWDSLRYGTLTHHAIGTVPDVVFRPTVGSPMTAPQRYIHQYDALGNMTLESMDEDLTGQGGWTPMTRLMQGFLPNSHLISDYTFVSWNGIGWDTTTAQLFTYNLNGPGGQPTEKNASFFSNGTWSSPYVYERYHYSAAQEMDTLWFNPYWGDSVGYEKHVFHGWHDYGSQLVDSASVYIINNFSPQYGLSGTHRTYYNGNTPQYYRHNKYEFGTPVERRVLRLIPEGFFELDSIVTLGGPPVLVYKGQYENTFDPQQRYMRRIKSQNQGPSPMSPLFMTEYVYLATTELDGQPSTLEVSVWPNPASEQLRVALPEGVSGPISLALIDMNGRTRLTQVETAASSSIQVNLGADLSSGTYLLNVHTAEGNATHKVLLQR